MLEAKGFIVIRVLADNKKKNCDFFASDENNKYLIEVKTKEDAPSFYKELFVKGIADAAESVGRSERIADTIHDALKQLNAHEL